MDFWGKSNGKSNGNPGLDIAKQGVKLGIGMAGVAMGATLMGAASDFLFN